jgi:hypothetical protein
MVRTAVLCLCFFGFLYGVAVQAVLSFDPNGSWQLTYLDKVLSNVYYASEAADRVNPASVAYSKYYPGDPLKYKSIRNIQIKYDRSKDEVTVTGDEPRVAFPPPRALPFNGNPYGASMNRAVLGPSDVAPGCATFTTFTEQTRFNDANTLAYYTVEQLEQFEEKAPGDCKGYLEGMRNKIKDGTAPTYWKIAMDSGNLDLNRIAEVRRVGVAVVYSGKRSG